MSDVNAARRKNLVDANTNEEEIIMPGHMKKTGKAAGMKKARPKAKRNGKNGNGLTAKQKTLPAFLQKKIRQAKKRGK